MKQHITKILIASNILFLGGLLWFMFFYDRNFSAIGHRPTSELQTDPKTGESLYHKNEVKNTILKNSVALQKCYQTYLSLKPKLVSGTIKIDWQILPEGKPQKIQRIVNQLGTTPTAMALESCVIENIQTWEFPPPPVDHPVYVAHSFYFGERKSGPPEIVNVK